MKSSFILLCLFLSTAVLAGASSRKEAAFHRFDKNGDGIVDQSELQDQKIRARFDRDGDGQVTIAEYRQVMGIAAPAGEEKKKDKTQPEGEHAGALARVDAYIKETDADGDGRLTQAEVGEEEWFDRIDRNGDGVIGKAEIAIVRGLVKRFGDRGLEMSGPPVTEEDIQQITSGPEVLKPGDVGIGRMIGDIAFTDIDGAAHSLAEVVKDRRGLVIAMTSATCPVSQRQLPSLAELSHDLARQDIALVLVNAFASESVEEIRTQLATTDIQTTYVHDTEKALSVALEATTTTEVFLIDPRQTLIYRGALDDQYGIDYSLDAPRHTYLRDAIGAFLKKESPLVAATAAPGCEIHYPEQEAVTVQTDITYHRDVSRILQANCVQCHHDDGIGPFSLEFLDEVGDRARVIRRVITEGTMPPWFAADPEDGGPTPWANDHSLSDRDKADLLAWLDGGMPEGDPADAPEPLTFPEEWTLGTPDMVIPLSRPYRIKATGFLPYQRDRVTTTLTEDKWVTGYEILPTERKVVHHVIVQVFEKGKKVGNFSEAQGFWAAYVPGNGAVRYPEGFARKLPAGSTVAFQIHYTPCGVEKTDQLKMGLHFADSPPKYEVRTMAIADHRLNIPAGAAAHEEGTTRTMKFDMPAIAFMAHMHTRGSAFSYELVKKSGETEMLLDIPRYDFNWQLRYELKEPRILPMGSHVRVTGTFDNSENNRANPDPTQTVRWGDQTVDEMLIGYIEYFQPIESERGEKVAMAE